VPPNGLEMSRPASQGKYRAKAKHPAGRDRSKIPGPQGASRSEAEGAPSSCWAPGFPAVPSQGGLRGRLSVKMEAPSRFPRRP
jgi:hypothetical protein